MPTDSPIVTVVIPTHNRRALLARALASVSAQTVAGHEVVIVDEASSDGTPGFVASIDDPRVRALRHGEPRGTAGARNAGMREANGRYLAFLDDDDVWAPNKLERQLEALDRTPGARWASAGAVMVDDQLRIKGQSRLSSADDLLRRLLALNVMPGGGSGVMVETALLREIGGFREDQRSAEDWECWIRLAREAPLAVVDEPLVAWRSHVGSKSHDLERHAAARARVRSLHEELARELKVGERPPARTAEEEQRYLARKELRTGNRRRAARRLATLGRRRPRYLLLAAAAWVVPYGWVQRVPLRVRRPGDSWYRPAETWLAPLRGWSDQPVGAAR